MSLGFNHLFTLEILEGCRWNCRGCFVNKKSTGWAGEDEERFLSLCKDFQANQDHLKDLVIGATDVMSAFNSRDILSSSTMQEILSLFTEVTFTTTFLDRQSAAWGATLNELIPENTSLRFSAIVDPYKFDKSDYLDCIKKNIAVFGENFKRKHTITFVIPTVIERPGEAHYLPNDMIPIRQLMRREFNYEVGNGQGVSFARTKNIKTDRLRILEHIDWLKNVFDHVAEIDEKQEVDFAMSRYEPAKHTFFSYEAGHWYLNPYLYDELLIHDRAYQVPVKKWQATEFYEFIDTVNFRQFRGLKDLPCSDCQFLGICGQRHIVDLMQQTNTTECLVPKKAMSYYGDRAWELRPHPNPSTFIHGGKNDKAV